MRIQPNVLGNVYFLLVAIESSLCMPTIMLLKKEILLGKILTMLEELPVPLFKVANFATCSVNN